MSSGGEQVVAALLEQGVDTVFGVPGESYLAVLDGLYGAQDQIRYISCRHESGAAFMACANARLRQRAGVVLVTRGPGATNATIALHVAQQASIPLVIGIGQVSRRHLGREAFQELDYTSFLPQLVKHVEQIEQADDLGAAFARAFRIAESGRPGPVALALPEDVLTEATTQAGPRVAPATAAGPGADDLGRIRAALAQAERPLIIAGGGTWTDAAVADLVRFAEAHVIPVMTAFRRQDCFDNGHPCYAGYLGYNAHPEATELAAEADCVLVLGARLDEPTTLGYTLFNDGRERTLIHVYPQARELSVNYSPQIAVVADIEAMSAALAAAASGVRSDTVPWCQRLNEAYRASLEREPGREPLDPHAVMQILNSHLRDDAVVTIDAGNFTVWPHRYRQYRRPGRLLGPVNGAMGHGVPSAIGAALTLPERQVIGCVGDGGMLMTGMELATAAKYGARPIILVFNNARYGTIEMHQDRHYPGRRLGTELTNPDFAAMARTFGLFGARVEHTGKFEGALESAFAAGTAAVIDLVMTPGS